MADDMAAALRADRCEHVWGEVLNVRGDSMTRTAAALRNGGFRGHAKALERVSTNKEDWECYARATFEAHAAAYAGQTGPRALTGQTLDPAPKLRFLQYVTKDSRAWWQSREPDGAILL
jgi:hypothetical protein